MRQAYPDLSCRTFKWNVNADKTCAAGRNSTLATVPAIFINFDLIADRVTRVESHLKYEHFQALIRDFEGRLGAPTRRTRVPLDRRQVDVAFEELEWRSGSETLRISTAHGCTRPGGCDIIFRLTDERTRKLREERSQAIEAQRPVVGNIAPTETQLAAGSALLDSLKRVFEIEALVPSEVRAKLGTNVEAGPTRQHDSLRKSQEYKVSSSLPHIRIEHARYELVWGYYGSSGGRLTLPIDDHGACISEALLQQSWGKGKVSISPPGSYSPNTPSTLAPKGMRRSVMSYTYTTQSNVEVIFQYSYPCATRIYMRERQPSDWVLKE